MKYYVSTNPQAGDREAEECEQCGVLIAPGAYLKHRDYHDSIHAEITEEFEENETIEELRERIDTLNKSITELGRDVETLVTALDAHEQDHGKHVNDE